MVAASAGSAWHVCVTGTGDRSDLRLDIPALTLGSQQIATLILTKSTGGVLLNALLLNQQGTLTSYANTSVRLRLVADAASGGVVSASGDSVAFGATSADANIAASSAAADLQVTSAGTTLWEMSGQTLTSGSVYTVFLLGDAGAPKGVLRVDN